MQLRGCREEVKRLGTGNRAASDPRAQYLYNLYKLKVPNELGT